MDAGHGSGGGRLAGSGGRALVGAQLRRVLVVGIVVPLAVGAVIALVGACWAYAAGAEPATMAMIAFTQAYPLTVGVCAVAVLAGDPLVEVQAALPVEFRCVQTLRAGLLLAAGMAGALLMFAPLEVLGLVYRDIGWAGALTPVGGAALMVLAAYVAVTVAGSSRSASLAWWRFGCSSRSFGIRTCRARPSARAAVARAARGGRWRLARARLARVRVAEAGRCAMRFLALARTHFRLAARQRALWIVSLGLALLSVTITVNPGLSFETDNPAALALTAQMLALMPPSRLRGGLHRPGRRGGAARYFGDRGVRTRAFVRVGGGARGGCARGDGVAVRRGAAVLRGRPDAARQRVGVAPGGRPADRRSAAVPRSSRRRFRRLPALSCRAPLRGSPLSSPGSGCSSSPCSCRLPPPGAACGSISRPIPWRRYSSAARRCSIPPSPR